eukprot:4506374-Pleurochrysis_carterae.AAC.1
MNPRNGCLSTSRAYMLVRGATLPYHTTVCRTVFSQSQIACAHKKLQMLTVRSARSSGADRSGAVRHTRPCSLGSPTSFRFSLL